MLVFGLPSSVFGLRSSFFPNRSAVIMSGSGESPSSKRRDEFGFDLAGVDDVVEELGVDDEEIDDDDLADDDDDDGDGLLDEDERIDLDDEYDDVDDEDKPHPGHRYHE